MFSKNNVSQSMIDAVESVLTEGKKLLLEPEDEKKDHKKNDGVKEELKGNQPDLDKNRNGKLDKQDFKLLRMKKEDIGGISTISEKKKKDEAIRVDTLKGVTTSTDPEVKIANAHFSGKAATLKAEGKGTETPSTFVTDSATHREINKAVKPTFKKIKEMLGKTGTSE